MHEPIVIRSIYNLEYSQEIFLRKESKMISGIIWIVTLILVAALCWVFFGRMEEVVRATGLIRPVANISQVKNAFSGEIIGLYYHPGQQVEKGSLLLQIDAQALHAKASSLKMSYEKIRIKIDGLKQIETSFYKDSICVDKSNTIAYTRFESYLFQKKLLEENYNLKEKIWQEGLRMPAESITAVKLRELDYEKNISFLNLETHKINFINTITTEYAQNLVDFEELKSQLEQVKQSLKNTAVYAPISGTVQELSSLNKHDYLFADKVILNIVPNTSNEYKVELKIPAKMSGKLEKGMKVKIRFPAFPFHEFGGAEGLITSIDPDASADSKGIVYFTVLADINCNFLKDRKNYSYPIRSGLEVDSRIILKEQSVLWYILKKFDLVW